MSNLKIRRALRDDFNLDAFDGKEALAKMVEGEDDFEVGGYRFINQDSIDSIMEDELSGDEYVLGVANAWFIAEVTGVDKEAIEAMQKADCYAAIGKMILSLDCLSDYQQGIVRHDGYGPYFAHYDGEQHELGNYYVFQI